MGAAAHRKAAGKASTVVGAAVLMILFTPLVVGARATPPSPRHGPGVQASLRGPEDLGEEVVSLRTATSRTYFSKQGGFKTAIFLSPVNYLDNQGHWQPIDNRLKAKSAGGYQSFANDFRVDLPPTLAGPISVRKHSFSMRLRLRKARPAAAAIKGNRARYSDAFPGVTARYAAVARGLKQEFVLASPRAVSSFHYRLDLSPKLHPRLGRGGALALLDRRGRIVLALAPPFMSDAAPSGRGFSRAVRYQLRKSGGHYVLSLVASRRWLTSRARRYPVVIDPSIVTADCTIKSGSPNTSFCAASTLDVGRDTGASSTSRALLPFNLSDVPAGVQVYHSELDLFLESELNATPIGTSIHGLT
jgi:hypothetical protein